MTWYKKDKIKEILFRLVAIPSISESKGEIEVEKEIYNILNEITYFKENPQYVNMHPIKDDKFGRYVVTALVKGKGNNTAIVFGHHDIVDLEGYGDYKDLALNPEELTKNLDPNILPEEAKKDLLSGEWIFGRGINDMKYGQALSIALMQDLSTKADELDGNVLFVSVPDEENNSVGMLAAVPIINEISKKYNLDCKAYVINEPDMGVKRYSLFVGCEGKVLPIFYCMGKETHSSHIYGGINAGNMIAEIEREMNLNTKFVDYANGHYTVPPTVLQMRDTKEQYNVSTCAYAYSYYTIYTVSNTPKQIMELLKETAYKAFENVLDKFKESSKQYEEITGIRNECPWKPKVLTYEELYNYNKEVIGQEFVKSMNVYIKENKNKFKDQRLFTIDIIKEAVRVCPNKEPKIIIAYGPPYYPHTTNNGKTEKERYILEVLDRVNKYSLEKFNVKWNIENYFGIADLCYTKIDEYEDVVNSLKPNMPVLENGYSIPFEDIKKLSLPVVNLGPVSKDPHKFTERLHVKSSFEMIPDLFKYTVLEILK